MTTHTSGATTSPYVIGAGLGILDTLALLTARRGLGVTTPFEDAAVLLARWVAPHSARIEGYLKQRENPPRADWESFLVGGMAIGSYLVARRRIGPSADPYAPIGTQAFGKNGTRRLVTAFLGGAVMMIGARMAKGCTSGHGLTGNMQLAVSSLVFSPVALVTSVLMAKALYGKGVSRANL